MAAPCPIPPQQVCTRAPARLPPVSRQVQPPGSPLTQDTALQNWPEGNHMSVGGAHPARRRCLAYCLADTGSFIQSNTCGEGQVAWAVMGRWRCG